MHMVRNISEVSCVLEWKPCIVFKSCGLSKIRLPWYDSVEMSGTGKIKNTIQWVGIIMLCGLTWGYQEPSNTSAVVGMKCFSYPDVHGSSSDELHLLSSSESTIFLYAPDLWHSSLTASTLRSSSLSINELCPPTIWVFNLSALSFFSRLGWINTTSNTMIFGNDSLEGLQIHVIGSWICKNKIQECSGIYWKHKFISLIMLNSTKNISSPDTLSL